MWILNRRVSFCNCIVSVPFPTSNLKQILQNRRCNSVSIVRVIRKTGKRK